MTSQIMSTENRLVRALEGFGLIASLAQLKKPAAIVADPAVIEVLRKSMVGEGARLISVADVTPTRFPTPLPGPYFVATAEDELAMKQRLRRLLRERGIQAEIYGVLHDLTPMPLTDTWEREPAGFEAKLESLYASKGVVITCTPRSGSQFLARKLEENGVGAPREHVRPGVVELLTAQGDKRVGGFHFMPWFASLAHQSSRNGIFATKLISHFLKDLETHLRPAEWAMLQAFIGESSLIYLLRSDKLMQALSRDRAKSTKHYHLFNEAKRDEYRRLSDAWVYDFTRIFREIQRLVEEETYLFDLLARIRPGKDFTFVPYEEMDAQKVAGDLRQQLKVPEQELAVELPTNILRDEQTTEFYNRFLQDYQAAFRPEDAATHVPLRVTYDQGAKILQHVVDPAQIVTGQ